jgi:hypothetical protein
LVAPLWLIFVLATFTPAWAQTVATDTGTFTGVNSHSAPESVAVFYGIRYAAPPLGAARWTPPQMPAAPRGKILADSPGPACPQPNNTAPLPQSEDCLFLNVYAPAAAHAQSKLPVFLWIHGGARSERQRSRRIPCTMRLPMTSQGVLTAVGSRGGNAFRSSWHCRPAWGPSTARLLRIREAVASLRKTAGGVS